MFSKVVVALFFILNVFLFLALVYLMWRYGLANEAQTTPARWAGLPAWIHSLWLEPVEAPSVFSGLNLVTTILAALGVLLTALGIFIGLLAIWGYQNLREHAKDTATLVAERVAGQTARQVAQTVAATAAASIARDISEKSPDDDYGAAASGGSNDAG